jgi:hypothetical protein
VTRPAATAWPASASSYLHSFCTMLQSLAAIRLHRTDLFEQSVMHSERLGSMLNSRALHSATQESCFASQPAAATQAAQPLAGCAIVRRGKIHPARARMRIAAFTILARYGASTVPTIDAADGQA